MSAPRVDFSSCAAARVEGQLLLDVITAVEAKAMLFAVSGAFQLLQQEDDGVVDDAKHPRTAHHAQRKLLQVEVGSGFKDAVNHGTPRN